MDRAQTTIKAVKTSNMGSGPIPMERHATFWARISIPIKTVTITTTPSRIAKLTPINPLPMTCHDDVATPKVAITRAVRTCSQF